MKKGIKRGLWAAAAVCILLMAAFTGLYFTRIQTIGSITQITDYKDGYNLYRMDVKYDYSLDEMIAYGICDDQTMVKAMVKQALPFFRYTFKRRISGAALFACAKNRATC